MPSIVNKFYVFDLAPGRSVVEYFVGAGLTVFMIAWRNPQPRHDRWGMPEYEDAIEVAIDAASSIRGVRKVNLWAVCGAGPVAVSLAGYDAARTAPADQLAAAVRRTAGHQGDGRRSEHRRVHRPRQPSGTPARHAKAAGAPDQRP